MKASDNVPAILIRIHHQNLNKKIIYVGACQEQLQTPKPTTTHTHISARHRGGFEECSTDTASESGSSGCSTNDNGAHAITR